MELEFLKALVLIFGVSALSIFLLHRLKLPPILGFILAGVLIGPHGAGFIVDLHEIEILAEIGVILLLFTVGIEFSLKRLLQMRKGIVFGGGGQVFLSALITFALTYPITKSLNTSVFLGFLAALSSTAIVLKLLLERGEMDTPQGRNMTVILIFQDLCVVPFMLLVPALSGDTTGIISIATPLVKAMIVIALVLLGARWIAPGLLRQVVHTRSRELFLITIILLCLGIALLTSRVGMSLALGAFLAGLILSESDYAYQAMSDVLPLKESFMGLFFVSIGMLIDIGYIFSHWLLVVTTVVAIVILKTLAGTMSLLPIGVSARVSIHASIGLAQIGEFSFILAAAGKAAGIIAADVYQLFLAASVITMTLTPLFLKWSPHVSSWLSSRKSMKRFDEKMSKEETPRSLAGHVIIIGFGLNGRNLADTLKESQVPYVVLELNSGTVESFKKKGEPIFYGDGTSSQLLHKMGISRARLLVVAISDPASTRKIVSTAKKENPSIHIIVRTRYLAEVDDLIKLGAAEVIPEEFETSVEIFSRVLHRYNIPRNVINDRIETIRKDGYKVFRTYTLPKKTVIEHPNLFGNIETESYLVKLGSKTAGRSLGQLHLRGRTGATVIAIERGQEIIQNPSAVHTLKENDVLLLVGSREDINRAIDYLDSESQMSDNRP